MNIVVSYRGIPHAPGRETGAVLARAFRKLGHSVYEYGNFYGSTKRISENNIPFEPDILIYCECNDHDSQYVELEDLKVQAKIYWDFDISTHPARTLMFIRRMKFDLVFFANKLYESSIKKICPRSYFLPYAIDDEFHRKIPEITKTQDIGLCGTPYSSRIALIESLNRAGIKARIFNGIYGQDLVRLINSFKIHLNFNPGMGRGLLVGRVWETPGCGTLLLTQQEDFIDLIFQNGKHLVTYRSPEECIVKARELLLDKEKREEIAKTGYTYVHENHTYVNRAMTILEKFSQQNYPFEVSIQPMVVNLEILRAFLLGGVNLLRWHKDY